MKAREKDIQELCKQVKDSAVIPECGDCGYTMCPLCCGNGPWNADDLSEIEHEKNCAYLIAKDLSTNVKQE